MKDVVLNIEFQMTVQVEDDMTDELIEFFFEENHCATNLILEEAKRIESTPNTCSLCSRCSVTVIK